jgi:hypothetical protein
MGRIGRASLTASTMVLLATTAAGCGPNEFETQPLKRIEHAAVKQLRSLDSVRVAGWGLSDGQSMKLDLTLDKSGRCSGAISMKGATADFLVADGGSYLKANRAFWKVSTGSDQTAAQISAMLGSRWAKLPATADEFPDMCDMKELAAGFGENADGKKMRGSKGDSTSVSGVDALELVYKRGKETTVVWVATEAPHNVLQVETTGGKEPGRFIFSGFDEESGITAPDPGQVVDIGKL